MYAPRNVISIGHQVSRMKQDFPQFTYRRVNGVPTWWGTLCPSKQEYRLKLVYRLPLAPQIWVVTPMLRSDAPHRYPQNGSLCLHYPRDYSWTTNQYLSRTIVLWAAVWLELYEIWLKTNEWYGPEAPHRMLKKAA